MLSDPEKHASIVPPLFQSGSGAIGSFYIGDGDRKVWVGVEIIDDERLVYVDCNRNQDLSDETPITLSSIGNRFSATVQVNTLNGNHAEFDVFQMEPFPSMKKSSNRGMTGTRRSTIRSTPDDTISGRAGSNCMERPIESDYLTGKSTGPFLVKKICS